MKEALKSLGLSTYESRILEALFKKKHTLKELSKTADIPAGKVYSIAKQLLDKQLICSTEIRPKELYVSNASEVISRLMKEHELKQDKTMSLLRAVATSCDRNAERQTPFFEIGTTIEDNKRIQMRTFIEAEKEVLQILNIHHKPKSNRGSKSVWENAIGEAVDRGVLFKAIYPKGIKLPDFLERLSKSKSARFNIKRKDLDFTRCDIVDGKKVMLKLVHEDPLHFGGILFIENKELANNLKTIFMRFWEDAE
ncbi:MAG: helix-turn-helix domain-containing protein [Candidatus Woesearchaeota archaeon]